MTVVDSAAALLGFAQRQVDRLVPPPSRQRAWDHTADFASAKPLLFTFLLAQLAVSFLPLLIFVSFILSTLVFAAGCAVIFTLFWLGVALLVLVPTLLITGGIAVLLWAWAIASFVIARWVWAFVPASIKGGWGTEPATTNGNPNANAAFAGRRFNFVAEKRGSGGAEVPKKEGDVREQVL